MPTYQYQCQSCAHEFEALQTMLEARLTKCPECGQEQLVRLIGSGSGMIFKGSGFYETDYKKKSAPATESKPETKTESKPAFPVAKPNSCGTGCGCHP